MFTYSEIEKIFDNCKTWVELQKAAAAFEYLITEDWIKSSRLYDEIIKLCDKAFRRIENLQ